MMNARTQVRITIYLLILVGVLHIIGDNYVLYWRTDWYDILLHFLGGTVLGSTTLAIMFKSGTTFTTKQTLLIILGCTLGGGFLWEVFEWVAHIQDTFSIQHLPDTGLDLIMDLLGGTAVFIWYNSHIRHVSK